NVKQPLVSVICHTFNHDRFIENALNAFLMQITKFPFEIIIHDDASTDDTANIVRRYAEKYPKIIRAIFQDENIFKKGLRPQMFSFPAASGKYIALCEGDDFWLDPNKLALQVMFLEANTDYSICYTDSVAFEEDRITDLDFGGARRDLAEEELMKAPAIFTLTSCFRNVLDVPPELACVKYGDLFIWSRLGRFGKGKFLDSIEPSMYRVHRGGMHSVAESVERYKMKIQTYMAMSSYYQRIGDVSLGEYFLQQALPPLLLVNEISPRLLSLMVNVTKLYRFLKSLVV
ncbi:glycosyltransferase family 2 protein, partial [Alloalcanivorax marinus]|uniref:glycosyltransferase family 2 protein n=1 Tax=Alloalcanivorax marinus TaxID=1177169 RepID=UPI0021CFE11D